MNYLQLKSGNFSAIYSVYRNPLGHQAISLMVSAGNLIPRFAPDVLSYAITPKLDSSTGFMYDLFINTTATAYLTLSSGNGL